MFVVVVPMPPKWQNSWSGDIGNETVRVTVKEAIGTWTKQSDTARHDYP